jgi:Papain-like cysteine protease AvrRpt2
MAIRLKPRTPRRLQLELTPRPRSEVLFNMTIPRPLDSPEKCVNPLLFNGEQQDQALWCWAAVAVSVNAFFGTGQARRQCELVTRALKQQDCCANGASALCNKSWFLDLALALVGKLARWTRGRTAFHSVKREIDECRPLAVRIGLKTGGGHFVVIHGYKNDLLYVHDPMLGESMIPYANFPQQKAYPNYSWTDSYYTKH